MKMLKRSLIVAAAMLAFTTRTFGIEDLKIVVNQQTNVVLSWPSESGEEFIVQYRATLNSETPWTFLTNGLPAATGTNRTTFVHSGVVQPPPSPQGGGSGGGGSPPSPMSASSFDGGGQDAAMLERIRLISRMPTPPVPWDPRFVSTSRKGEFETMENNSPESGGSSVDCGFYRVVREGIHLFAVTNGTELEGVYELFAEFGATNGILTEVTVMNDGAGFDAAEAIIPTNGPLSFILYTPRMTNGMHTLQLRAHVLVTNTPPVEPSDDFIQHFDGEPVMVDVFNEISFPYWERQYFEDYQAMYVQARSAHPNVSWRIDFYGDQDDYIGGFNGATSNGFIAAYWNLRDPFNNLRTDDFFTTVVTTQWSGPGLNDEEGGGGAGQAQAASPPAWKGTDYFPSVGQWVVFNQQAWEDWNNHELLDQLADDMVFGAELAGFTVLPQHPAGEAFRVPVSGSVTQAWHTVYNAITNFNSRNLYYMGHGSSKGIGGFTNQVGVGRGISGGAIGNGLRNKTFLADLLHGPETNPHRYRFVFLDGCSTADGPLPFLFGVTNNRDPMLQPYQPGEGRPAAFMGYSGKVEIGVHQVGIYPRHPNYVSHFFFEWLNGEDLVDARERAFNLYNDVTGFPIDKLKIIGYERLGFTEANTK